MGLFIFNIIAMFILGAFVGKFMAFTTKYLPKILLEDIGEPNDVWRWFFKKPHCRSCQHRKKLLESLPILGCILQKGNCPYCKRPLGIKSFILEIFVSLMFGVSVIFFPLKLTLAFILFMSCMMIMCFITDLEYSILPDQFTLTMIWAALIASLAPIFVPTAQAIIGAVGGYGIFWLINLTYQYYRGAVGMYPGDFKLNAAIGATLGIQWVFIILIVSFIFLLTVTITQFLFKKKKSKEKLMKQEAPYGCYSSLITIVVLYLLLTQLKI